MENIEILRTECEKLRRQNSIPLHILAHHISEGDDIINPNAVSMALTGYRKTKRSLKILQRLKKYLEGHPAP